MVIGLDIDNVISAFDEKILAEFLKEDRNKRGRGIIDKHAKHMCGMFDWSQDEVDQFFANNMEEIAKVLKTRRNCKFYMDKLLEDGHELVLITHRVFPHYKHPLEVTKEWLVKRKINYTKLVLSNLPDKTQECLDNHVDVMVDDRDSQCEKMIANGVTCLLMLTKYNKRRKANLPCVSSWKNLYEVISTWGK